jgi:hypothetical protein
MGLHPALYCLTSSIQKQKRRGNENVGMNYLKIWEVDFL